MGVVAPEFGHLADVLRRGSAAAWKRPHNHEARITVHPYLTSLAAQAHTEELIRQARSRRAAGLVSRAVHARRRRVVPLPASPPGTYQNAEEQSPTKPEPSLSPVSEALEPALCATKAPE